MFSQKNKQGLRNPWVWMLAVVVLAGVVVNGKMVLNVLQHPARLLDENYTVREHNKYDAKWVQQQAERSESGWQAKLGSAQQLANDPEVAADAARFIVVGNPSDFVLELHDKAGGLVTGAQVRIDAQWPADAGIDFRATFSETSPGRYSGSLKFPRSGNWFLVVEAMREDYRYEMEQKIFVAASLQ